MSANGVLPPHQVVLVGAVGRALVVGVVLVEQRSAPRPGSRRRTGTRRASTCSPALSHFTTSRGLVHSGRGVLRVRVVDVEPGAVGEDDVGQAEVLVGELAGVGDLAGHVEPAGVAQRRLLLEVPPGPAGLQRARGVGVDDLRATPPSGWPSAGPAPRCPNSVSVPITRRTLMTASLRGCGLTRMTGPCPRSSPSSTEPVRSWARPSGPSYAGRTCCTPPPRCSCATRRAGSTCTAAPPTRTGRPRTTTRRPAGSWQYGEEPAASAARELAEELGVTGADLRPAGAQRSTRTTPPAASSTASRRPGPARSCMRTARSSGAPG